MTPVSAPGPGSIIASPGPIQLVNPVSTINPAQLTQSGNLNAFNAAQILNPCGPIVVPGTPGASAPPLWIVPPGTTNIIGGDTFEGDISTVTNAAGAGAAGTKPKTSLSIDDLNKIQIPWWIIALAILILFLGDKNGLQP